LKRPVGRLLSAPRLPARFFIGSPWGELFHELEQEDEDTVPISTSDESVSTSESRSPVVLAESEALRQDLIENIAHLVVRQHRDRKLSIDCEKLPNREPASRLN